MGSVFSLLFKIFVRLITFFMGIWILTSFFGTYVDGVVVFLTFIFNYFIGSIMGYDSVVLIRDFLLLVLSYYFFSYIFQGVGFNSLNFSTESELLVDIVDDEELAVRERNPSSHTGSTVRYTSRDGKISGRRRVAPTEGGLMSRATKRYNQNRKPRNL